MTGLFIPGITAEMFRNGCLESIEALMAEGEIYDIDYSPWILVSERLPEENDYRPCTDCEWNDGAVLYCTDRGIVGLGWYYHSTKCWANLDDMWIKKDGKVVAWMPLPEPQKQI